PVDVLPAHFNALAHSHVTAEANAIEPGGKARLAAGDTGDCRLGRRLAAEGHRVISENRDTVRQAQLRADDTVGRRDRGRGALIDPLGRDRFLTLADETVAQSDLGGEHGAPA